jgi:hypothetical protein
VHAHYKAPAAPVFEPNSPEEEQRFQLAGMTMFVANSARLRRPCDVGKRTSSPLLWAPVGSSAPRAHSAHNHPRHSAAAVFSQLALLEEAQVSAPSPPFTLPAAPVLSSTSLPSSP